MTDDKVANITLLKVLVTWCWTVCSATYRTSSYGNN